MHGGPLQDVASGAKREPWQGQSQLRSARFQLTWQPRWVQRGRHGDQGAVVAAVAGDLLARVADDVALARREVLDRPGSALGDAVAEEVQPDLRVLLDELGGGRAA